MGSWRVLQLAWAVASKLAQTGACATLDVYAANWLSGAIVASLPPDRLFTLHREVSLIAETEPTPGFGHAVHTRGMMKVGRPGLIAGVPADRIEETGRILNHLARMLAEGHILLPGQRLRFDVLNLVTYLRWPSANVRRRPLTACPIVTQLVTQARRATYRPCRPPNSQVRCYALGGPWLG